MDGQMLSGRCWGSEAWAGGGAWAWSLAWRVRFLGFITLEFNNLGFTNLIRVH